MRRLAQTLGAPAEPNGQLQIATVDAVTGAAVSLQFADGTVIGGIPRLDTYNPSVGDTAVVWVQGSQIIVLGALA